MLTLLVAVAAWLGHFVLIKVVFVCPATFLAVAGGCVMLGSHSCPWLVELPGLTPLSSLLVFAAHLLSALVVPVVYNSCYFLILNFNSELVEISQLYA